MVDCIYNFRLPKKNNSFKSGQIYMKYAQCSEADLIIHMLDNGYPPAQRYNPVEMPRYLVEPGNESQAEICIYMIDMIILS